MQIDKASFEKYLFVCEHHRAEGSCCSPKGEMLRDALKKKVKDSGHGDRVRVSRSGCLDVCADGPNILLMPDAIWFKHVTMNDLDGVIGETVKRLVTPAEDGKS